MEWIEGIVGERDEVERADRDARIDVKAFGAFDLSNVSQLTEGVENAGRSAGPRCCSRYSSSNGST